MTKLDPTTFNLPDLPITHCQTEILAALKTHQILIVVGDTGCGKTTQLPKLCLKAGLGQAGWIGHTQPRRIAATSVATRIAEELKQPLGQTVGYQVRFNTEVSDSTQIKLMTDGILLNEIHHDPHFKRYDVIIIDEAHERNLNSDFLIGYLKRLLPQRPDLKLIITSATIHVETFVAFFKGAAVFEIPDRTYPIEIHYHPVEDAKTAEATQSAQQSVFKSVIQRCLHARDGDILVFLSSEQEIREWIAFSEEQFSHVTCLPLYGRLPLAQQQQIFRPGKSRRIIFATNIAETSITVPNIVYVIDFGMARVSRFNPRFKIQQLPLEKISQASAKQRAGRCGRVAPGVCHRLYSETDFEARDAYTTPEIQRTNLAAVILKMKALDLEAIETFPFIDAPQKQHIRSGIKLLQELQALSEDETITRLGREIARVPTDPRLARMLFATTRYGALEEVLIIASFLSGQDPRVRPHDAQTQADQAHAKFRDKHSDFMSIINLWSAVHTALKTSKSAMRRFCEAHYLSIVHVRNWLNLYAELKHAIKPFKFKYNDKAATPDEIHRAVLQGMLSHVARKNPEGDYVAAYQKTCQIFPGSGVKKPGAWIVAAQFFETRQLYAQCVASINGEWLNEQAKHLITEKYGDPYYSQKKGAVVARCYKSLFGLSLPVAGTILYHRIDPTAARQHFIEHAVVEGLYHTTASWSVALAEAKQTLMVMEHKLRKLNLFDAYAATDFYASHLPKTIYSVSEFESWWRQLSPERKAVLSIPLEACLSYVPPIPLETAFPDSITIKHQTIPLIYVYDASADYDGLTAVIPTHLSHQLTDEDFQALVPGLRIEKIVTLLKSLPKIQRQKLHPINTTAEKLSQAYTGSQPFYRFLAKALSDGYGLKLSHTVFKDIALPNYLKMGFVVTDDAIDRSVTPEVFLSRHIWLASLNEASETDAVLHATQFEADTAVAEAGEWVFEDVPVWHSQDTAFPALTQTDTGVVLMPYIDKTLAATAHRVGVIALCMQALESDIKRFVKQMKSYALLAIQLPMCETTDTMYSLVVEHICQHALDSFGALPRNSASYDRYLDQVRQALYPEGQKLLALMQVFAKAYQTVNALLDEHAHLLDSVSKADITQQLAFLTASNSWLFLPYTWLTMFPKYLQGISLRIPKAIQNPGRDIQSVKTYSKIAAAFDAVEWPAPETPAFEPYLNVALLLQEVRTAVFAQQIKTREKASVKRLQTAWDALAACL